MSSMTATVVFTDLVGSTALLSRLGVGADAVRRAHFAALRGAIVAHGGEEVKNLGDGLMVSFRSAGAALRCAVGMQQAIARLSRRHPQSIRIGLSAGDVTVEDGDLFGSPVIEAARLCAAAGTGQILVSDLTLALAAGASDFEVASLGPLQLKGFNEPIPVSQLTWSPPSGGPLPLPQELCADPVPFFIERAEAGARLSQLWKTAAGGTRQAVLVAGEPGIGKTRVAVELAKAVHAQGATVLYGRCEEDQGDAYQPFADAIGHYVSHCWLEDLAVHVDQHGGELTRLVPEIARRFPAASAAPMAAAELYRMRLFEAVNALLTEASHEAPVLLIVDDLHWAAKPTLLMLRHLLDSTVKAPILVIGTYRDTDLSADHPLVEALGEWRGLSLIEHIILTGLDAAGVAAFVEAAAGHELDDRSVALARAVHAQTDGNPFFVGQVLRHLQETGIVYRQDGVWSSNVAADAIPLPEGVRLTVRSRVSRLSAGARQALAAGAVVGREFGIDVLERAGAGGAEELLDALEEGVRARLLVEVPSEHDRFAFTHALVRHTVYDDMTAARRSRLHRRVGEALEALHRDDLESVVAALAHHFCAGVGVGGASKAVDYALAAAQRALDRAAHEDAESYLERGLTVLDSSGSPDLEKRCDLLLALARTRAQALDNAALHKTSLKAAELARALKSPERLARAAYWYNARATAGTVDPRGVGLCEEALVLLGDGIPTLRALVMATLARERAFGGEGIAAEPLSREALDLAQSTDDPEVLAVALMARYYALWGSERVTEQLEVANRLLNSSAVTPSGLPASIDAHRLRATPLFALGDVDGFGKEMEELAWVGEQLHNPYCLGLAKQWQAALALLEGDFASVEPLAGEAVAIAGDDENFKNSWVGQIFHLHSETGRLDQVKPLVSIMVDQHPGLQAFRAALAFAHASLGELDESRHHFQILASNDFSALSRNILWPATLSLLSEVCARLGDENHAQVLYDLLRPHGGLLVVVAGGSHSNGAADRYLGMLATVLQRWPEAEAHFEAAVELEAKARSAPLLGRTRYWYARMLLARDGVDDRIRAEDLLAQSLETARSLGMRGLMADTAALAGRGV